MHSRVQSFSRTLTAQSGNSRFGTTFSISGRDGANEPSWMSRVKRATRAEDIVINRDDDESPESLAEKGMTRQGSDESSGGSDTIAASAKGARKSSKREGDEEDEGSAEEDDGTAAMFGAAPEGKVGAGKKEQLRKESKEKKKKEEEDDDEEAEDREVAEHEHDIDESGGAEVSKEVETVDDVERGRRREARHGRDIAEDERREDDDNPPRNILADLGADADDSKEAQRRYKEKMAAQLGRAGGKGKGRQARDDEDDDHGRSRTPSPVRKHSKPKKRDPRLEARYCRGTQTWKDGRKVPPFFFP